MWPIITLILIELCGARSFQVRECATECLCWLESAQSSSIDRHGNPVRDPAVTALDQEALRWGLDQSDPEIRRRLQNVRPKLSSAKLITCPFLGRSREEWEQEIKKIEERFDLTFRYATFYYAGSPGFYTGYFVRAE